MTKLIKLFLLHTQSQPVCCSQHTVDVTAAAAAAVAVAAAADARMNLACLLAI